MGPQFDYGFEMRGQPDTQRVYDAAQNLIERLVNFIQAKIAAVQTKGQGILSQITSSLSSASQAKAEQANKTVQTVVQSIDAKLAEQIGGISERLSAYTTQLRSPTQSYGSSGTGYSGAYLQPTVLAQPSASGQPMSGLAGNAPAGPTVPYTTPIVSGPPTLAASSPGYTPSVGDTTYWVVCSKLYSVPPFVQTIPAWPNGPVDTPIAGPYRTYDEAQAYLDNNNPVCPPRPIPIQPTTQPTTPAPTPPPTTVPTVPPTTSPPTTPPTTPPTSGLSYWVMHTTSNTAGIGPVDCYYPISFPFGQRPTAGEIKAGPYDTIEQANKYISDNNLIPCSSQAPPPTPPPPIVDCPDWVKACIDYALKGLKEILDKTPPLTGDPVLDIVSGNMDEDKGELTKLDPQFIGPMFDANSGDDLNTIVEKSDYWRELLG